MRDEKFDEYYFDKKKNYKPFSGEKNDKSRSRELHEGFTRQDLSNPGISSFSYTEPNDSSGGKRDQIKASGRDGAEKETQEGRPRWYHGSEDDSYQPNNLEASYYEHEFYREPGLAEMKLYEEILEKIMDTPEVNASEVEIKVDQTRVLLSGSVDTRKMKELIADIAKHTSGVNQVINDIVVKRRS